MWDTIREVKLFFPNYDEEGYITISHKVLDIDKIINIINISKNCFFPDMTLGKVTIDNKEIDTSKTFGELNIKANTEIYIEIKEFSNIEKNKDTDEKKNSPKKKNIRKAKPISEKNKTNPLENYIECKIEIFDKQKEIPKIEFFLKNEKNKDFESLIEDYNENMKMAIEPNLNKKVDLYCNTLNDDEEEDVEILENYKDCVVVFLNDKEIDVKKNEDGFYCMYYIFDKVGIYNIKIGFKKKMETISFLFNGIISLIEVDMTHLNMDELLEMAGIFRDCLLLKKINFNIDTSKIKNFNELFGWCYLLEEIKGIENLKTENGEKFNKMFARNYLIKELDISKWDIKNLKESESMFEDSYGIELLKVNKEINEKIIEKEKSYVPSTTKVEVI